MSPTVSSVRRPRPLAVLAALLALVLVTATGLARAPRAAASTDILIGTHNTLHGTSGFSGFADVIGWQELDNAASINRMKAAMTGYSHCVPAGVAEEDTISWRSSEFTAGYCGARLTHKGEAGVTPNRYVVYQTLTLTATGQRFTFVNTHFISGAFSGHPERQDRWHHHMDVLKQLVSELQAKGLPVVVVGDFNRPAAASISGLRYYPYGSSVPLDQMYASTANSVGSATRLAKDGSDHYAYRATFRL